MSLNFFTDSNSLYYDLLFPHSRKLGKIPLCICFRGLSFIMAWGVGIIGGRLRYLGKVFRRVVTYWKTFWGGRGCVKLFGGFPTPLCWIQGGIRARQRYKYFILTLFLPITLVITWEEIFFGPPSPSSWRVIHGGHIVTPKRSPLLIFLLIQATWNFAQI